MTNAIEALKQRREAVCKIITEATARLDALSNVDQWFADNFPGGSDEWDFLSGQIGDLRKRMERAEGDELELCRAIRRLETEEIDS